MFTKLPMYNYNSDDSNVTLREIPSSLSSKSLPLQSEQVDDKNHRPLRQSLSSKEPEFASILPEHPNFQYARKTFSSNKGNSVLINISLKTLDTYNSINIDLLLDCEASGLFIDKQFIELNDITTQKLPRPIPIYNVDGTLNEGGTIKEAVDLIVSHGNHKERATFWVCGLGADRVILGLPWLRLHNSIINWSTGKIELSRCPRSCGYVYTENKKEKLCKAEPVPSFIVEDEDEGSDLVDESDWYFPGMEINFTWFDDEVEPPPSYEWIFFCNQENDQILKFEINRAEADHILRKNSPVEESEFNGYSRPKSPPEFYVKKNSIISDIPIPSSLKPPPVPFEQLVPPHYHEFLSVFDEKPSEHCPLKKPWDHAIDLRDMFVEQKARP